MSPHDLGRALLVGWLLAAAPAAVSAEEPPPPTVHDLVRAMTRTLAEARSITVHVEKTFDDVLVTGEKLQYSGALDIALRRPDRLHVSYGDDLSAKEAWFDGERLTLVDLRAGVFGDLPGAVTVDATLDAAAERFGLRMPLAALLSEDAYEAFAENVTRASYIGVHDVGGVPAHHLLFGDGAVDWQLWIDAGETPLPLKLVVTYADEPREPQTTFLFEEWNLAADLPDDAFTAVIPEGAARAAFLPLKGE